MLSESDMLILSCWQLLSDAVHVAIRALWKPFDVLVSDGRISANGAEPLRWSKREEKLKCLTEIACAALPALFWFAKASRVPLQTRVSARSSAAD
jgi:hypothetical protein